MPGRGGLCPASIRTPPLPPPRILAVGTPSRASSEPASCCPPAAPLLRLALSQLRRGQSGTVRVADLADADAAMLGAMGLSCNAKVRLCRAGEPCIVNVTTGRGSGCRIGLARPLAERIMVEVEAGTAR